MEDHGGNAFADTECDVKINERSVVGTMPLLSEFTRNCEWGGVEAQRFATVFYNRPVSLGIDYFISNLNGITSRTEVEAGGVLKHKLQSETDESGELRGDVYEPIYYVWMFKV